MKKKTKKKAGKSPVPASMISVMQNHAVSVAGLMAAQSLAQSRTLGQIERADSVRSKSNEFRDLMFGSLSLRILGEIVAKNAISKGFRPKSPRMDVGRVATFATNLHGEVSEYWEAFRKGALNKPCDKAPKMVAMGLPVLTCAEEELADILIRVLDTADAHGIDIQRAAVAKHIYNTTRSHMHGKKA